MFAPMFDFAFAPARRDPPGLYRTVGKRIVDVGLVILALPVVLPVLAVIVAVAGLTGRGVPLYAQLRVGRNGRVFRMWKVRTMVPDADAVLARLIATDPAVAAEWVVRQKLSRDPRITLFGRFLRRTSLDELPQLWNVLTGRMSLVGPRPFTPEQASLYLNGARDAAYYRVRPGLTGAWQIGPRNTTGFADRAVHDEQYWRGLHLTLDLSILMQTFLVVFRGTGA